MITLYTFGPAWGLPDPSPFVTKAIVLLKMAGLPFETDTSGFRKAPRGKLPYIRDGGEVISNSTLIRLHLEQRHNIDFERGLTPEQRGVAWAAEKMCEDHLYWFTVQLRWLDGDNFERGPLRFFDAVPAPLRPYHFTDRPPPGPPHPAWPGRRAAIRLTNGRSSRIAPSPRSPRSWAISPI